MSDGQDVNEAQVSLKRLKPTNGKGEVFTVNFRVQS